MKWIWVSAAVIAVLVVVILLVGWLLPEKHRAQRQATLQAPPETVWELIDERRGVSVLEERRQDRAASTGSRGPEGLGRGGEQRPHHAGRREERGASSARPADRRSRSAVRRHLDVRDCASRERKYADDYRGRSDLQSAVPRHGEVRFRLRGHHRGLLDRRRRPTGVERTPVKPMQPQSYVNFILGLHTSHFQRLLQISDFRIQSFFQMGYDATATLKFDGKTSRGVAQLEHKDLVFRGTMRLAIPLASISAATARDGTLYVRFGEKSAELTIGSAAEKWARRITNPPSRLDKLGVKAGMTIAAIGISDEAFLGEVAERAEKVTRRAPAAESSGRSDLLRGRPPRRARRTRGARAAHQARGRRLESCGRRGRERTSPRPRRWPRASEPGSSTSRS